MGALRKTIELTAAAAACLALSACLISEEPLLDAANGNATPIADGDYVACQTGEEQSEPDCKATAISHDDTGLYRFVVEGEDEVTLLRFRKLALKAWTAQLSGEDDDDYFYFIAKSGAAAFSLTMIVCEDIPKSIRNKYVKRGEMDVDESASVCTAKSLRAVTASAKAYLGPKAPKAKSQIVYTKAAAAVN